MSVTETEEIFASPPVVDHGMTVEDRYQRKPVGTADQGHRDDQD